MPTPIPRRGLLGRLLVATLVPTAAALALFGLLAHEVARRTLDDELGRRLALQADTAARAVLPDQVAALRTADEGSLTYASVSRRLQALAARFAARRVLLCGPDLVVRYDSEGRIPRGEVAHELEQDRSDIDRAGRGTPSASVLFSGRDGLPYKRGYAAVGAPPDVAGFVAIEGSAATFSALSSFRRWLLGAGLLALGAVIAVTAVVARRLTRPVRRLAEAAARIGAGELNAPVPPAGGDEIGLLAATLDDMREALRARDERLQMMLAGIAHEVRNPLGGIELYAGLLREALAGHPERLAEIARIEREIGYLKRVVGEFLDYARRPVPVVEPIAVDTLLGEVREVVAADDGATGRRILVAASGGATVAADRGQLRCALLNLAGNALAATPVGGTVTLGATAGPDAVVLEVRDTGPGVPPAERERIFAPFYTTREKGTGLGLAFVRDIARAHRGEVAVDEAPGGGARFRLTLPLRAG